MFSDIFASALACVVVDEQCRDAIFEMSVRTHAKAASASNQVVCFAEFSVVRPENDGNLPHSGFERIVYAHAKTAAHIRHTPIAVERRQHANRIDHKAVGFGSLLGRGVRVKHKIAAQFGAKPFDVQRRNHMRRNHHAANVFVGVDVAREQIFVGFPSAARHKHFVVGGKSGRNGQIFGGSGNVGHTVETGVVAHNHIGDAMFFEQLFRGFVLHIKRCVTV